MRLERLRLRLIGGFVLEDAAGVDRTPRGVKARGVLVLLALAPRHRRSRRWIEARLWSERDATQASGSLRQTLSELRRSLGDARDAVLANRVDVWLDPAMIGVDVLEAPAAAAEAATRGTTLADGLDARDEAFEEWLREERAAFAERASPRRVAAPRLELALHAEGEAQAGPLAHQCAAHVARLVGDFVEVRVRARDVAVARLGPESRGVSLVVHVRPSGRRVVVAMKAISTADGAWLWSGEASAPSDAMPGRAQSLDTLIFDAADAIFRAVPAVFGEERGAISAEALLSQATRDLFSFDPRRLETALATVERARALAPDARFDAWQSLICASLAIEGVGGDRDLLVAQATRLADESLACGGENPLVLALAGHVRVVIQRDLQAGLALARKSLALSPGNPFAAVTLKAALTRSGRARAAYAVSRQAEAMTRRSPIGHWWSLSASLSAIAVGEFDDAIRAAEATRAMAPKCRAALRTLYALYTHRRDPESAHRVAMVMRRMEPDFSLAHIREDRAYPADTLRATGLANLRDIM